MKQQMIEVLESQRLELAKLHQDLGSMQDYLDRGRPSTEEQAEVSALMKDKDLLLAEREKRYKNYLQTLRQTEPDTVSAWVEQHLAVIDAIINTPPPSDLKISEKSLPVRLHVARETAGKWREVLAGTRDYVHINWYFLADYESRLKDTK